MSAANPIWRPDAYPANVLPRDLAQVTHAGRFVYVESDRLDAGDAMLATYSAKGIYARKHVLACHLNASEPLALADGVADQSLITGVAPVPQQARMIAAEQQRRGMRRLNGALPAGGLWDETSHRQSELFG